MSSGNLLAKVKSSERCHPCVVFALNWEMNLTHITYFCACEHLYECVFVFACVWERQRQRWTELLSGPKQTTHTGRVSPLCQRYKAKTDPDQVQAQWPHLWNTQLEKVDVKSRGCPNSNVYVVTVRQVRWRQRSILKSEKPIEKLQILLGEGYTAPLAAQYVSACHNLRDSELPLSKSTTVQINGTVCYLFNM